MLPYSSSSYPATGPAKGYELPDAGVRVLLQKRRRGHHHAGGAEPALQPVLLVEPFLHRRQLRRRAEALDREDLVAVRLDAEEGATLHGQPVEEDGAGPAACGVAAEVSPGQAEDLPDEVEQQQAGLNLRFPRLVVDDALNHSELWHVLPPCGGRR